MRATLFSLLIIFSGLSLGYALQKMAGSEKKALRIPVEEIRRVIQLVILSIVIPITAAASIWIAPLKSVKIAALPFLGAFAILFGGLAAYGIARLAGMNRDRRGVFAVAGGFTNMGSLGGLVVFILLGEAGFALVAFYQLFEKFVYFLIGFPFAKSHSSMVEGKVSRKEFFLQTVKDPVIILNTLALVLGTFLNLTGVPRPDFFYHVNRFLVPFGSFGLLFTIGLAIRFGRMKRYAGSGMLMILIKSLMVPAATFAFAAALGLGQFESGIALKTVLILSAMPVGFMSLVPPTLYKMDLDLANTCWFFSTASLLLSVPILAYLVRYIGN